MATVFRSTKPCYICKKAEKTVQLKNADGDVPLCLEHFYERVEVKPKSKKKTEKKS